MGWNNDCQLTPYEAGKLSKETWSPEIRPFFRVQCFLLGSGVYLVNPDFFQQHGPKLSSLELSGYFPTSFKGKGTS